MGKKKSKESAQREGEVIRTDNKVAAEDSECPDVHV